MKSTNKQQVLFIIVLSMITIGVHSQPVINLSNLTTSSYYKHYFGSISNFNTKGGANQVWDYSTTSFSTLGTSLVTSKTDTTKFYSKFPTSNWVVIESDGSYNYSKFTADSLFQIGGANGSLSLTYSDYLKRIVAPLAYQSSFTDTYSGIYSDNNTEKGSSIYNYDAYGTLKTPFGNFDNVVRLQYTKNTEQRFQFWTTNPLMLVAEFTMSNQILTLRIPKATNPVSTPPPVLVQSKLITNGNYEAYTGTISMIAPTGGPDQLWDFSTVSLSLAATQIVTARTDTTKYFSLFPSSNWVIITSDGSYNYMKYTADSLFQLGGAMGTQRLFYTNYSKELIFPFNYLNSYNDVYAGGKNGSINGTYDGYGILKSPFGSFDNVVRVKYVYNGNDVIYRFWTSDPIMVIAEYEVSNRLLIVRKLKSASGVATVPENKVSILVTKTKLIINTDNSFKSASIFNLLGKNILNSSTHQIDISSFKPGSYLIEINVDGYKTTKKFIKQD